MLITYTIFILIAITFKFMQWPGSSVLMLFASVFVLIDVIIQLVRKREDQLLRIISAIGVLFLSFFITFRFLRWPGSTILLLASIAILGVYFYLFFKQKKGFNVRFFLVCMLLLFSLFNFSLKNSTFSMLYMAENPFTPGNLISSDSKRSLAFDFYREGEHEKAAQLIQLNIDALSSLLEPTNVQPHMRELLEMDLNTLQNDLKRIEQGNWNFEGVYYGYDFTIRVLGQDIYE